MRLVSSSSELFSSVHALEMDRNTTLYDPENNQMSYFMSMLPLLKPITLKNQSFIKWYYSKYLNLNLVSQNFPRVLSYVTLLFCNEPFYPKYRKVQTSILSIYSVFPLTICSFFVYNEEVVESSSTIFE